MTIRVWGFLSIGLSLLLHLPATATAQTWQYDSNPSRGGYVKAVGPATSQVVLEFNCDDGSPEKPMLAALKLLRPGIDEHVPSVVYSVDGVRVGQVARGFPGFHEGGWMEWTVTHAASSKSQLIAAFKKGNDLRVMLTDGGGKSKAFTLPLDGFTSAWGRCSG